MILCRLDYTVYYSNVRSVWKEYIIKCIAAAERNRTPIKFFVNLHHKNNLSKDILINETTALLVISWSEEFNDSIFINEKTFEISGCADNKVFNFYGMDILQLTPLEDLKIKIDPKMLKNSKKHLYFKNR